MILPDGIDGAETGDDAFPSPAVSHHIMVNDAAGENDSVGLGGNAVDRHLGSPARLTEVNHVFYVSRVMIDHFHSPADLLAAELFHLRFGIESMASHDDQDGNV